MTAIVGLELDKALEIVRKETGCEPAVERAVPPHGVPSDTGVWRVVRVDLTRGCITAAFFPLPAQGSGEGER